MYAYKPLKCLVEKYTGLKLKKSTPLPVVAVAPNMSYTFTKYTYDMYTVGTYDISIVSTLEFSMYKVQGEKSMMMIFRPLIFLFLWRKFFPVELLNIARLVCYEGGSQLTF